MHRSLGRPACTPPADEASRGKFVPSLDQVNYNGLYTDSPAAVERAIYAPGESLTVAGRIKDSDAGQINYVVIPKPTVRRRHALIEFSKRCFRIADEVGLDGTFIDDRMIEGDTRLKHGDRVRFHAHEFELLLLDVFETDRTLMRQTLFADLLRTEDGGDRVRSPVAAGSSRVAAIFRENQAVSRALETHRCFGPVGSCPGPRFHSLPVAARPARDIRGFLIPVGFVPMLLA